jgi:hypothetical protein
VAKCKLDLSDSKLRILGGNLSDSSLQSGLTELQTKLLKDHRSSHWVPHPMPGYPQYANKIWKWDFAPVGERSSSRPGWRLLAYVPDPQAPEPIPARAFVGWDKDRQPKGNPAKFIADVLKEFLSLTVTVTATPDRFRRQFLVDGKIVSLCLECCGEPIFSDTETDADTAEAGHVCAK